MEEQPKKGKFHGNQPKSGKKRGKPATDAARTMFLYGEGDGVRILEVKELAERSGVCEATIRARLPEWQSELEESLKNSSKLALTNTLSISNEVFEDHSKDLCFFRRNLTALQTEHDSHDSIITDLRDLVSQFVSDEDKYDQALNLLDRYLRLSMNKRNLMNQIIALKKIYDEKCGLDTIKSVQEATMKAQSLGNLKNDPSPQQNEGIQVVAAGVFRKREV